MKRCIKKISLIITCIFISTLSAGCTIGEYRVLDFYSDENGDMHFTLFGQRGPHGEIDYDDKEEAENETPLDENNNTEESDKDTDSIVGTSLKKGWNSLDNSILKGINVSVKKDSILFSIDLKEDKEVTISYDIILDDGEYSLVYVNQDNTKQVLLQDDKKFKSEEKLLLKQGKNEITILSSNAVFKKIDISITGIEVSDFE